MFGSDMVYMKPLKANAKMSGKKTTKSHSDQVSGLALQSLEISRKQLWKGSVMDLAQIWRGAGRSVTDPSESQLPTESLKEGYIATVKEGNIRTIEQKLPGKKTAGLRTLTVNCCHECSCLYSIWTNV